MFYNLTQQLPKLFLAISEKFFAKRLAAYAIKLGGENVKKGGDAQKNGAMAKKMAKWSGGVAIFSYFCVEMRLIRYILIFALLFCSAPCPAAGPKWETVQAVSASSPSTSSDKVEAWVRDGYIYLSTPKPQTVKVLSIVGQLISEQQVPAGESRLRITARGIYILKVGEKTFRVTI